MEQLYSLLLNPIIITTLIGGVVAIIVALINGKKEKSKKEADSKTVVNITNNYFVNSNITNTKIEKH